MKAQPGQRYRHPLEPRPICRVEQITSHSYTWVRWESSDSFDVVAGDDLEVLGYELVADPPEGP